MFYKSILALVLLGVFSSANALELDIEDNKKPNYLLGFFVVEAILGVNAWMASEAPNGYGTISALAFPLAGKSEETSDFVYWTGLAAIESVAIYNINLDSDEYSKSEIFRNNMKAWHAAAGVILAISYIDSKWINNDTISVTPISNHTFFPLD